jgi:folate-binding protein YgfZ
MAHQSPLNSLHDQAEASFLVYGDEASGAPVVETYGEIEAEYAALRKGCVLLDCPHVATLWVTGGDRLGFLNRMITQELAGLGAYQCVRSFWLNRKGRIDADLRLASLPGNGASAGTGTADGAADRLPFTQEGVVIAVDILSAAHTVRSLDAFIIADDVTIQAITEAAHRLALIGPTAAAVLASASAPEEGPAVAELRDGQACLVRVDGHLVLVEREDTTGETGLHLTMATEHVEAVYARLLAVGRGEQDGPGHRLRPAGWHAYNIARIEAGTPIYNVDFGPDNLPAETGVLSDRVSFRKGCYLGQEIVARMHALGHPKQVLVALRIPRAGHEDPAWQPATGSPVLVDLPAGDAGDAGEPKPVGRVTSSTRSPMLGDDILTLAQVRWGHHEPGTVLRVQTSAGLARATVNDGLASYRPRLAQSPAFPSEPRHPAGGTNSG